MISSRPLLPNDNLENISQDIYQFPTTSSSSPVFSSQLTYIIQDENLKLSNQHHRLNECRENRKTSEQVETSALTNEGKTVSNATLIAKNLVESIPDKSH